MLRLPIRKNFRNEILLYKYNKLTINGCENLWIEIKLQNYKQIMFGVIYRHPTRNIKDFQHKQYH